MLHTLLASGKSRPRPPVLATLFSAAAHVVLVAAIVVSARPVIHLASKLETILAQFLFPTERRSESAATSVTYIASARSEGSGITPAGGTESADALTARHRAEEEAQAREQPRATPAATVDPLIEQKQAAESFGAFTLLDVDSAAVRDPRSTAPTYPKILEAKGVEGFARMRFVVDSSGLIDLSTVETMEASNPEFARAVRAAMPGMLFRPAMMGDKAVRQLSEQNFSFRIQATKAQKKP